MIDSSNERIIFLHKTCHGDFLVIKRQQSKPNIHDWISINHTIVPIKFLNHLKFGSKAYQRRIFFFLTEIFFWLSGYSQTNGNRRAGVTRLSVTIAVPVVLWVRSPSDNQFGSLQEIERLESAWGLKSSTLPPITQILRLLLFGLQ